MRTLKTSYTALAVSILSVTTLIPCAYAAGTDHVIQCGTGGTQSSDCNDPAKLNASLTVADGKKTTLGGELQTKGAAQFDKTVRVTGATNLDDTLTVADDKKTTLGGELQTKGAAQFDKTVRVTGATNLDDTLTVEGATQLNDTLTVEGKATLKNGLAVTGDVNTTGTVKASSVNATKGKFTSLTTDELFVKKINFGQTDIEFQNITAAQGLSVTSGATVDMGGNRVQNVGNPQAGTDAVNLSTLNRYKGELADNINSTGAIAAAMSQITLPNNGATNNLGVALGYQEGKKAFAVGYSHKMTPASEFKISFGTSGNITSVGSGVNFSW